MSIAVLLRSRRLVKEAPVAWPCQLLIKTKCGLIEQISRPPSQDYPLSIRLCAKICEEQRSCPGINSDLWSFLVFITSHISTGWRLTKTVLNSAVKKWNFPLKICLMFVILSLLSLGNPGIVTVCLRLISNINEGEERRPPWTWSNILQLFGSCLPRDELNTKQNICNFSPYFFYWEPSDEMSFESSIHFVKYNQH